MGSRTAKLNLILGGQLRYALTGIIVLVANRYLAGTDALENPGRHRFHSDDSNQVKWSEDQSQFLRVPRSPTGDACHEPLVRLVQRAKLVGVTAVIWVRREGPLTKCGLHRGKGRAGR